MNFNKNQLKAINHYTGNCAVLASAGSGKTSVLIHRIANLINKYNVSPTEILAITFSRKAADNMKNRLKILLPDSYEDISIDTFHATGYKILKESKYYSYSTQIIKDWEKTKIINEIVVKEMYIERNELDVDINGILNFISYQKNHLKSYKSDLIDLKDSPYNFNMMKKIYTSYETKKQKENKIDFDDMIMDCYNVLESDESILVKYQERFKFILVDEMQDTNEAQYEIIRLLGKANNNVFVVGDALQCIYQWRFANNNYLINFYKDWIDTTVINLNTNYRSTDNIVKLSNQLVKNITETTHEFYVESIADAKPFKDVQFNYYVDECEEAESIAKKIIELKQSNYETKDFAILVRTNFQLQAIENALYNNELPYLIVDGKSFYERKEIQDMIYYLRLASNYTDDEAFKKIYNVPNRYLGMVFLQEVQTYATKRKMSLYDSMSYFPRSHEWRYKNGISELKNIIETVNRKKKYTVGTLITIIREGLRYDKYISKDKYDDNNKNEKSENLDILVNFADKYTSIKDFLTEIDQINGKQQDSDNCVKVMTIHKSKGLEFPVVFVAGVSNFILPHSKSDNIDEERRLLYVAMTRAEKELYLSATERYGTKSCGLSDFLYDIFDENLLNKNSIINT